MIGALFGRKKPNVKLPVELSRFHCPKCLVSTKTLTKLINHHRNEHEQREARIRRVDATPAKFPRYFAKTPRRSTRVGSDYYVPDGPPMLQHEHLEKMGLI